MRSLTLAEFKQETEHQVGVAGVAGVAVPVLNGDEEEVSEEIEPDEISPELLYTAEHPVFVPRVNVFSENPPGNGSAQGSEAPGKRRRGRRGGRRGRGGDDTPSGTT
jgi:hypothetical protein